MWTGGIGPYAVYRSSDPATLLDPANRVADTPGQSWADLPPAGGLTCYMVMPACIPDGKPEICDGVDNDCDGTIDGPGSEVSCDLPNAIPVCEAGLCRIAGCADAWADCDQVQENGCEAFLLTITDCGACGVACTNGHGWTSCPYGGCAPGCDTGWGDCDGNPNNGCETDLSASAAHCGGCGQACALDHAIPYCAGSTCFVTGCETGWGDCDGIDSNGCEAPLTTLQNCGGCGVPCNLGHAAESCATGQCILGACDSGWGNCNGGAADGCETALTSLQNCGDCGTICNIAHATESCASGHCYLSACDSGWANCELFPDNDCEVQLNYWANDCSGADWEGEKCGDQHQYWPACDIYSGFTVFKTATGRSSRWMYARATECSACSSSVEHALNLEVPDGVDYDLYVYSACGQLWTSNIFGPGGDEYVSFSKPDRALYTDSYYYWVEVRFKSGSSCEPWTLTFSGRQEP